VVILRPAAVVLVLLVAEPLSAAGVAPEAADAGVDVEVGVFLVPSFSALSSLLFLLADLSECVLWELPDVDF